MIAKIGLGVVVGVALSVAASGCESTDEFPFGTPKVSLGPVDGGSVIATIRNPCAIDLDFGPLPIGAGASAFIQVENTGVGALDLSEINPSLNPEFGVNYGTQQPIQLGGFNQFAVTFEASRPGTINSSFTIETDGYNSDCPTSGGLDGSTLTIALSGSASN
jgi:hypothetical protein